MTLRGRSFTPQKSSLGFYDCCRCFRAGRYHMSARNMSSAVVDRLMGYAIMMVRKVWLLGNAVKIHSRRTPHTPMMVSTAGTTDIPKPRR